MYKDPFDKPFDGSCSYHLLYHACTRIHLISHLMVHVATICCFMYKDSFDKPFDGSCS